MSPTNSKNDTSKIRAKRAFVLSLLFLSQMIVMPLMGSAANPIDTLEPGHWYEVPNSHLRDVAPKPLPPGIFRTIITAWSGGAYDTTRDRLIIMGGGMLIILEMKSMPLT